MGNLVFSTDPHLNFVSGDKIKEFAEAILRRNPSVVVLGGDISEAPTLEADLRTLEKFLKGIPLYFVCGNHDYYYGSINVVRNALRSRFTAGKTIWLPTTPIVDLGPRTALLGHDAWYDGGYPDKNGDWHGSMLDLSDYHVIQELSPPQCFNKTLRYEVLQELSKEGADHIKKYLPKALEDNDKVFFVQHVSPFAETSCGPDRQMSDKDWMPHFCSRQTGEAFMTVMNKQPAEKELIILCGHSHTSAWHRPLPNVYCYCGPARYGQPQVAQQFSY